MPHAIRPLTPDDLPALSRFLTTGFHAPADAPFAAIDVLRWKYFDPRGAEAGSAPRSLVGCDEASGEIVGHVGICPARWHGPGLSDEGVSTLHMIDWLASAAGAGVGAQLMRRAHQSVDTQYGFGGSAAGRGVIDRGGYGLIQHVPVYQRASTVAPAARAWSGARRSALLRVGKDVWQNVPASPGVVDASGAGASGGV
ncbi:MAG: hypothetical protein U0794_19595 [Isosphaeraceae bacterium]